MKFSGIAFLVHESFLNIRRNGLMSLAALGTVTVALTVLGATLWTAHRVNEYAQLQPQKFNQVDIFLKVDASREQANDVKERIRRLPETKDIRLIEKETAWAKLQADEPRLTEAMDGNPLPDKLEITAAEVSKVESLARALRNKQDFPEIAQVNDAGQEVRTMLGFARVIKVVGGGAALGLFIATLFIVQNTIRLTVFARRRDIHIMQLVGATSGFIRLPMLLEGLFHGIVGALIASAVILLSAREVSRFVTGLRSPLLSDVPTQLGPFDIVIGLVAIGAFVGLVGSYLSMRRFLKQI